MRRVRILLSIAMLTSLTLSACVPTPGNQPWRDVREVTPSFLTRADASDPSLAVDERGHVALTWVTRDSLGGDAWLVLSADSGEHWSEPHRLNTKPQRVSNYPESRPVVTWGRAGLLAAAWAATRDSGMQADDVAVRVSADGGRSWGPVALVNNDHGDPSSTYHGFIALDVLPDGRPAVAWLGGRTSPGEGNEPARAELYASTSADGGEHWSANTRVAVDVCPCCRITMKSALRPTGGIDVAVAYRGARDDLRDPRLAISHDGAATFAFDTLISADRWKLPGCPSVGPAITMDAGGSGHYAWFTGESPDDDSLPGRPAPGVYLVPWRTDAGAVGAKRALADSLGNVSRPMLATLEHATLVGVLGESAGVPSRKVLALRRLELDGTLTPWLYLGSGVKSAAIAARGAHGAWAAWSEKTASGPRVRVARLAGR